MDCKGLKSFLNVKTTNRHTLRWKIAIQEYRSKIIIIYKEGKTHNNFDGLSRWPLDNVKGKPSYDLEVDSETPIHFMEIDRRKNLHSLSGPKEVVPQIITKVNQGRKKLPYWE
ncbi:hypothetical protein O181_011419 [Austropuccinia psidii MF-1]|uniref:Uncharacterized protein n=1 Tax=Austropuccinia psidii MF-1 TaxID=1389203 RepID=A0A9Q3BST3_9BASI|nr:hypothetical protein [Austropuccinia psidii MF-1]